MDRAGFKIIHISRNECNGGSFRIYVVKRSCSRHVEATAVIQEYLEREEADGIHTVERYARFMSDCTREIDRLLYFIRTVNDNGKKVYIYGASTKGNCLLQVGNITADIVPYAVERNPLKFGKMTSTQIPIISEEQMRKEKPEFLLVLPWHFKEGILEREKDYLCGGGQLLFPFPQFEVVGQKPRALVTGCNGQIAKPVIEELAKEYTVYGLTNRPSALDVIQFTYDDSTLEPSIMAVHPSVIVHLASITLTETCEQKPVETTEINGLFVGRLCDIIHRNRLSCKLFNASSSELYRGHVVYTVKEGDTNFFPTTMYGIAKEYGHRIVEYYRTKYGLPFSNGVLFTTESRNRKGHFLLRKIADHARTWHTTYDVLHLGSLSSYRPILHAKDAADAIVRILQHPDGNTYNICGSESLKVEELVIRMYRQFGIHLVKTDTGFVDDKTGLPVIEIGKQLRAESTNITADMSRLAALGWHQTYSVDDILADFV
jgi:GDP-D-mannose dehydratase